MYALIILYRFPHISRIFYRNIFYFVCLFKKVEILYINMYKTYFAAPVFREDMCQISLAQEDLLKIGAIIDEI